MMKKDAEKVLQYLVLIFLYGALILIYSYRISIPYGNMGFSYEGMELAYDNIQTDTTLYEQAMIHMDRSEAVTEGQDSLYVSFLSLLLRFFGNKLEVVFIAQIILMGLAFFFNILTVWTLVGKRGAFVSGLVLACSLEYVNTVFEVTPETSLYLLWSIGFLLIAVVGKFNDYITKYGKVFLFMFIALASALILKEGLGLSDIFMWYNLAAAILVGIAAESIYSAFVKKRVEKSLYLREDMGMDNDMQNNGINNEGDKPTGMKMSALLNNKPEPEKETRRKKGKPVKEKHIKEKPIKEKPVKEKPIKEKTIKEKPIKRRAQKESPIKEKEMQVNNDSTSRYDDTKGIKYIENPLPLPKKPEKTGMDFNRILQDSELEFDIEISDDDDFDI